MMPRPIVLAVVAVVVGLHVGDSPAASAEQGLVRSPRPERPDRVRHSIDGPLTREAVTRSFRALMPLDPAGDADPGAGPTEVSVMLRIEFEFDSVELTPSALRDLEQVAGGLIDAEMTDVPITLEGHTDFTGEPRYNRRLSRLRAEAVQRYLIRHGIAAERLRAVGHGADHLLDDLSPTDGRQRRVELVFAF